MGLYDALNKQYQSKQKAEKKRDKENKASTIKNTVATPSLTLEDILEKAGSRAGALKSKDSFTQLLEGMGGRYASQLGGFSSALTPLAFTNLAEILLNKGRTDPRAMNFQLGDIAQGTIGAQDALRGHLAELGLGRSGVGIAAHGAIGQAGADRRARLLADEARMAEERRRSDLQNLFTTLISDPTLGFYGLGQSLKDKQQARSDARNNAALGVATSLLSSFTGGLSDAAIRAGKG